MLKVILYGLVLALFVVLGLAIGAANDTLVDFDYLIASSHVSVATVLVSGVACGFLLGLYVALLFCLRVWRRAHQARVSLRDCERRLEALGAKGGDQAAE
ncbi:MAG: lipopolysaccharide assembly protein LapA domain-containing protein [Succinivibrionaceae bacterium]|nr:lipopolysaccharide assembly protein LapA domain-containing protein [Succinivibrionaceae bacterium]